MTTHISATAPRQAKPIKQSAPALPEDTFISSAAVELWRDFGINPAAMARRAFVEKAMPQGARLPQGVEAPPLVMRALQDKLHKAIESSDGLAALEVNLKDVASSVGVDLSIEKGAPLVNWDSLDPTVLDVRHHGGPAALHEMVHVVQCIIGGAAALGQAASKKFRVAMGREAANIDELRPFLEGLSKADKAEAMKRIVKPMETLAYSRFEQTAFHTAGMSGRKSKDYPAYKQRLQSVADAFVRGYTRAQVPELKTDLDARIYGGIAHLGRTHGETALLLAGAGAVYYGLARQAMRVHPALAIPMACPLGYLLYRSLISG